MKAASHIRLAAPYRPSIQQKMTQKAVQKDALQWNGYLRLARREEMQLCRHHPTAFSLVKCGAHALHRNIEECRCEIQAASTADNEARLFSLAKGRQDVIRNRGQASPGIQVECKWLCMYELRKCNILQARPCSPPNKTCVSTQCYVATPNDIIAGIAKLGGRVLN